jgi:hypothetical protein
MQNLPDEEEISSQSRNSDSLARVRLTTTIERWAFGAGTTTGAIRALLADVTNAIKNSRRAFSEAHRKAYSKKHAVRRKL